MSISKVCEGQSVQNGNIGGKVIDSVTNQGVDFATIGIFKAGATSPFNGTSTDQLGAFSFSGLPVGEYHLTIVFLGYRQKIIDHIIIGNKTNAIVLGNIKLAAIRRSLGEVNIVASKPVLESKVDKLIYNAANDLAAQGGVATDVLTKLPMVSVDIDGNVELQGNANVRFLINGKPASIYGPNIATVLQTIPASQIKSIEVITTPGAKYDAAGTAGVINIVLKDNKMKGINGSVNLSAGTRLENGSFNLGVKRNNTGLNLFFSGNDQLNSNIINTATRLSFNPAKDTISRYIQNRVSPYARNSYQSGVSFDWDITPNNVLTTTVGFNHIVTHFKGNTAQDQQTYLSSGEVLQDVTSRRVSAVDDGENAANWSLGYKRSFGKKGRELNVLYTSSYARDFTNDNQVTSFLNGNYPTSGIISNNKGDDHETDISIDYAEPLGKGFSLETGFKTVLENINSRVVTDTLLNDGGYANDAGQTFGFNFKRNIYAGYFSASFTLFKGFLDGRAGIRYEYTGTRSNLQNIRIPSGSIWAPNFLVEHKLDETQAVKLAYSYRIERPEYSELNPFLDVIDPHNIDTGNPLLKNETGQKIELGYHKTFKDGSSIYLGGFYNYNANDIQYFTTFYPVYIANGTSYRDVSLAQSLNIGSQTTIGANISGSVIITDKLNMRSDISLLSKNNNEPGLPSVGGFSYRINLNTSYRINDNTVAEVFGNLNSRRVDFQNTRPGYFIYTLAIKKQLFSKKAALGFISTNPFNKYIDQRSTAYGVGFTQTNLRQKTMQSFGITMSYKFGQLKTEHNKNNTDGTTEPAI